MRQAVALLIMTAIGALFLSAGTAHAKPFDGPESAGATFAAGVISGIACWTIELAAGEDDDEEGYGDEQEVDYARRGWFLGAQGVYAREDIDVEEEEKNLSKTNEPFPVEFSLKDRNTGGLRVKAGRRCNSRVSVEFEVEWLDDFDAKIDAGQIGRVNNVKFTPYVASVNAKGYLLTGRIQPFALLGVGVMGVRTQSKNSTGDLKSQQDTGLLVARFGGGVDFYVTENWVLAGQADYVYSATNLKILNYISVGMGVTYRF